MPYYEKEDDIVYDFAMVWDVMHKNHFEISEDLFQVGCIGLLKASRKFDPTKKFKFSTLAHTCIRNEILMHLRQPKKFSGMKLVSYEHCLDNHYLEIYNQKMYHEDTYYTKNFGEIIKEAIYNTCQSPKEREMLLLYYKQKLKQEPIAQAVLAKRYDLPLVRISRYVNRVNKEIRVLIQNYSYVNNR